MDGLRGTLFAKKVSKGLNSRKKPQRSVNAENLKVVHPHRSTQNVFNSDGGPKSLKGVLPAKKFSQDT